MAVGQSPRLQRLLCFLAPSLDLPHKDVADMPSVTIHLIAPVQRIAPQTFNYLTHCRILEESSPDYRDFWLSWMQHIFLIAALTSGGRNFSALLIDAAWDCDNVVVKFAMAYITGCLA